MGILKLDGKVALVTGASQGIGLAIVKAFVDSGALVIGCSRSFKPGEVPETCLSKVLWIRVDVGNLNDVKRLVQEIKTRIGRVDVLVNNAGLLGPMVSLTRYPLEDWDDVVRTNLTGPFLMVRHLLPLMSAGASIINVSSGFGLHGRARAGAYGVTKFGLEGFSQILAEDLLPNGIRVNIVDPGAVRTRMRSMVNPDEDPMDIPHPDAIMPVFVFLASDASRDVTKQRFEARHFLKLSNDNNLL